VFHFSLFNDTASGSHQPATKHSSLEGCDSASLDKQFPLWSLKFQDECVTFFHNIKNHSPSVTSKKNGPVTTSHLTLLIAMWKHVEGSCPGMCKQPARKNTQDLSDDS